MCNFCKCNDKNEPYYVKCDTISDNERNINMFRNLIHIGGRSLNDINNRKKNIYIKSSSETHITLCVQGCNKLNRLPRISIIGLENKSKKIILELKYLSNFIELDGLYSNIDKIEITKCHNLKYIKSIKNINEIDVSECNNLESITYISNINSIKVYECNNLNSIKSISNIEELILFTDNEIDLEDISNIHYIKMSETVYITKLLNIRNIDSWHFDTINNTYIYTVVVNINNTLIDDISNIINEIHNYYLYNDINNDIILDINKDNYDMIYNVYNDMNNLL
jgi:hypothetical protein